MGMTGRMRWAAVTVLWSTLFILFLYLFLPTGPINGLVASTLATQGLTLTPAPRKAIIPGLTWASPQLSSGQGALIRFEQMSVRPVLIRLLTGCLAVNATAAQAGGGTVNLDCTLNRKRSAGFTAERLQLGEIPFFKTILGATVWGTLRCEGQAEEGKQGWNGEFKVEITGLEYVGVRMGGFSLPDAAGLQSKGMIRLANGKARVESFTIQGEGVYMRLSGDLPTGAGVVSAPLNLVLEIMPKPDFLERQKLVFLLLAKFMTSPGVYRIPITGTLLNPQIL
jgi:type II secretion system protein N